MDTQHSYSTDFILAPADNKRLLSLCGQFDEHLHLLEEQLKVKINSRGHNFQISGANNSVLAAEKLIHRLYAETANAEAITPQLIHLMLNEVRNSKQMAKVKHEKNILEVGTKHGKIRARSQTQQEYVDAILHHDLTFGIGPAGTGKTYLAVAAAVDALEKEKVSRILLVRPAVEAGERLGFLPGDLAQKIDPYCRPLFDALHEMMGFERVAKLIERQIIEVAPLAYMRGRTLNDAFIILDEGQNTTQEQMKMFLTRMGFNCKVVVTGDVTQIDLPRGANSGLKHAEAILQNIEEIAFIRFAGRDVVRHNLVRSIVAAYDNSTRPDKKE